LTKKYVRHYPRFDSFYLKIETQNKKQFAKLEEILKVNEMTAFWKNIAT